MRIKISVHVYDLQTFVEGQKKQITLWKVRTLYAKLKIEQQFVNAAGINNNFHKEIVIFKLFHYKCILIYYNVTLTI